MVWPVLRPAAPAPVANAAPTDAEATAPAMTSIANRLLRSFMLCVLSLPLPLRRGRLFVHGVLCVHRAALSVPSARAEPGEPPGEVRQGDTDEEEAPGHHDLGGC